MEVAREPRAADRQARVLTPFGLGEDPGHVVEHVFDRERRRRVLVGRVRDDHDGAGHARKDRLSLRRGRHRQAAARRRCGRIGNGRLHGCRCRLRRCGRGLGGGFFGSRLLFRRFDRDRRQRLGWRLGLRGMADGNSREHRQHGSSRDLQAKAACRRPHPWRQDRRHGSSPAYARTRRAPRAATLERIRRVPEGLEPVGIRRAGALPGR